MDQGTSALQANHGALLPSQSNKWATISVENGVCRNRMGLVTQTDNHSSPNQQFYLGRHGSIFSSICPGLVISADANDSPDANFDLIVRLETFCLQEKNLKWRFMNGTIESVKHPGMVVSNSGTALILQNNSIATSTQSWIQINTRHLNLNNNHAWKQDWMV